MTWALLTRCTNARTDPCSQVVQTAGVLVLDNDAATVTVDPERGGRLASLVVHGRELLVTDPGDAEATMWGCFPMLPWAGRVRHGRFTFDGQDHQLEINAPPHSIHGIGAWRPWDVGGDGSLHLDIGHDRGWPFGGTAVQRFALHPDRLVCGIEVAAGERPMPAQLGWHPWFRKPDSLRFQPFAMYRRDDESIPTGELVEPSAGPWDDCFIGVHQPILLGWGDLEIELTSTCDHWVLYDEPPGSTCVEPQSGPPDGFTIAPHVVEPGTPLHRELTIAWGPART